MRKKLRYSILFTIILLMMMCTAASAKTGFSVSSKGIRYYNASGYLVKGTWFKSGSYFYYAKSNGYLATGLYEINNNLYYFNKNGQNQVGWQKIGTKTYYFMRNTKEAIRNKIYTFVNGRTYAFNANGHRLRKWQNINGKYYYFFNDMKYGWIKISGKTYYCWKSGTKKGSRAHGLNKIAGNYYYFDPNTGVMQKNKQVTVKGVLYDIDANGICVEHKSSTSSVKPSAKMLFFLTFESGSEAYDQTGGDGGKACGAYQFDYRFSLLPIVQYAYNQDKTLCAEFKPYINLKSGDSLKSNKNFYKAWHTIYKRNPKKFASIQDTFAKDNYYTPSESYLLSTYGINIKNRPDVVKGAVYSYSIQHGQVSAAIAVKKAGITNSTSDKTFLKKLYDYRIKQFPQYSFRYTTEYQLALTLL